MPARFGHCSWTSDDDDGANFLVPTKVNESENKIQRKIPVMLQERTCSHDKSIISPMNALSDNLYSENLLHSSDFQSISDVVKVCLSVTVTVMYDIIISRGSFIEVMKQPKGEGK